MSQPSADDFTPTDRPITMADINAVRKAAHNAESHAVATYELLKKTNNSMRVAVATCVACAFFCLVSAVVAVASVAQATPARVVTP
jgi:hypothetical protein